MTNAATNNNKPEKEKFDYDTYNTGLSDFEKLDFTQLSEGAIAEAFENWLRGYRDKEKFPYIEQIQALRGKIEDRVIYINHIDLPEQFINLLFKTRKPEIYFPLMLEAIRSIYKEYHAIDLTDDEVEKIDVRLLIDDPQLVIPMKAVNIDLMGKIILFDAQIVSTSEIKSALRERKYKCDNEQCGILYSKPMKICTNPNCQEPRPRFSLIDSTFTEFQLIELQERQETNTVSNISRIGYNTTSNNIPIKLEAKLYGSLVNKFKAGDNVRITGIPKIARPVSDRSLEAAINEDFSTDILYDLIIETHNISLIANANQDRIINDPSKLLTEEDKKKIVEFRNKFPVAEESERQLMQVFVDSFCPFIHGYENEKEVILLQLVGAINIVLSETKMKRADINVIFIGDPGTTKSSMLEEATKLAIHGIYTSGKGSSGVGLTASVDKDGGKGINKLKVGAAVIADRGLCAVDEFLHINEEDRSHLLECMEQGTFHINKNGINAILNTRASFLMATNSINGKYNPYASLKENVPISDQLWSRFDFITVMRDIPNREKDNRVSDHIISLYDTSYKPDSLKTHNAKTRLARDMLFRWIVYAKSHNTTDVKFTNEAISMIKSFYNEIRQPETETDVTATPRQLEGLLRLCIARARIMLRDIVLEQDAKRIIEILTYGYQSTGMMIKGGSKGLNMTAEYSTNLKKLGKPLAFKEVVLKLTKNNTEPVEKESIEAELIRKAGWSVAEANDFVTRMYEVKGELLQVSPRKYLLDKK